ncbi:hypothetical protein [Veillonella sp.]|uniref:hypothetical protein n=1 Tax=Veillonella sp. TaxID=1926307 RepID=UPI00290334E9|nr:hypothetical protein [Veillonella sp.]MDU2155047.1 hypothetical protein [Veillonella sp.]
MAFNPKNEQLTQAVRKGVESEKQANDILDNEAVLKVPVNNEADNETTKHYTFTLQPSVRRRLDAVAKEKGFKSASKFLNALISEL